MTTAEISPRQDTRSGVASELWASLLRHQVALTLPLELPFLHDCPSWCQADRVIDLGTGAGEHLFCLHHHFPEKNYTGIDLSTELIGLADRRLAKDPPTTEGSIRFRAGDGYTYQEGEVFDVALARLLIQHLRDLDRFLANTAGLLRPGGALLVIESDDTARRFVPELPLVSDMFEELRSRQRKVDGRRDAGRVLQAMAPSHGFRLERDQTIVIPSTLPTHKDLFRQSYSNVFRVVRQHYGVSLPVEDLEDELERWYRQPASYAQIGLSLSCYVKE